MLSSITSYFWGNEETEELAASASPEVCKVEEGAQAATAEVRLKETQAEDEDWTIVDTSSRGASPPQVTDHPMENLLIEHPSMSVYGPRTRQSSTGTDSNKSDSPTPTSNKASRMLRHPPRRPGAIAARAGMVSQVQCIKSMQVVQRRKDNQRLSKGFISRSNKVSENSSRNRHSRRKHYMLNHSGRSNNRQSYTQ